MRGQTGIIVLAALVAGCAPANNAPEKTQIRRGLLRGANAAFLARPRMDDFVARIRFPYRAPPDRRAWIERAFRVLKVGTTEAEVLSMIGEPDYKAPYNMTTTRNGSARAEAEVWHYVVLWNHLPLPKDSGTMLILTLRNSSVPRKVVRIDKIKAP